MAISAQRYRIIHDLMLHEAACAGDEFKLASNLNYVKRGKMDINFKDDEYGERTPLHCAAGMGIPLNYVPTNYGMLIRRIMHFLASFMRSIEESFLHDTWSAMPFSFPKAQFKSETVKTKLLAYFQLEAHPTTWHLRTKNISDYFLDFFLVILGQWLYS